MSNGKEMPEADHIFYCDTLASVLRDMHISHCVSHEDPLDPNVIRRYHTNFRMLWETVTGNEMPIEVALYIFYNSPSEQEVNDARGVQKRKGY